MYVFKFRFPYCCLKAIWVIKLIEIGVGVERLFGIAYSNNYVKFGKSFLIALRPKLFVVVRHKVALRSSK